MVNVDEWTIDLELMLDKIRQNCVILSEQHKKQFFYLQSWLKYFRLPCIVLCSINAVASIGLQSYIAQRNVSLLNCLISLLTTIITSTELYLQIEKQMSVELDVSKDYYLLSIDIHKTLALNKENRNIDASTYLDSCMSMYKNLFVHSMVLEKKMKDKLTTLDCDMITPDLPVEFANPDCKDSHDDVIENVKNSEYFIDMDIRGGGGDVKKDVAAAPTPSTPAAPTPTPTTPTPTTSTPTTSTPTVAAAAGQKDGNNSGDASDMFCSWIIHLDP